LSQFYLRNFPQLTTFPSSESRLLEGFSLGAAGCISAQWKGALTGVLESTVDGSTWLRRFSSYEADHNRMAKVRNAWLKIFQDLGCTPRFISCDQLNSEPSIAWGRAFAGSPPRMKCHAISSRAPCPSSTGRPASVAATRRCRCCRAGAANALNEAARMVNRGGRICLAAFPAEPVPVDLAYLVRNNIYVFGIRGEGKSATHRAAALMAQKRFDAKIIHTHTFPLAEVPTAIKYARERIEDAIKVVVKIREN